MNELEDLMSEKHAESSEKKVKWAIKNYTQWRVHAIEDDLDCNLRLYCADIHDSKTLGKASFALAMCKFITEVVKLNSEDYPPNSLKELVYCIQMFLHSK